MSAPRAAHDTGPARTIVTPGNHGEGASDDLNEQLVAWVLAQYPADMAERIMRQDYSEIGPDFLGFLHVYLAASLLTRPSTTVIDFGCYLAAQAALFHHCAAYIGVDTVDLERFTTANTSHTVDTITNFIDTHPELTGRDDVLAVCSYVPNTAARRAVNAAFLNVVNIYPHTQGRQLQAPPTLGVELATPRAV